MCDQFNALNRQANNHAHETALLLLPPVLTLVLASGLSSQFVIIHYFHHVLQYGLLFKRAFHPGYNNRVTNFLS